MPPPLAYIALKHTELMVERQYLGAELGVGAGADENQIGEEADELVREGEKHGRPIMPDHPTIRGRDSQLSPRRFARPVPECANRTDAEGVTAHGLKKKTAQLEQALLGTVGPHQRLMLRHLLNHVDFLARQIGLLLRSPTACWSPSISFPWSPTPPPPLTVSAIVSKTESAVVTVKATLFRTCTSQGSGFLIDKEGDVITNAHVVAHATDVSVIDSKGAAHSGTLIGIDQAEDLAEVRVLELAHYASLTPASRVPAVGTDVLVLGNPFGQLPETVTKGIISGVGRDEIVAGTHYFNLLQIDAVVNPGNNGGPVLDLTGRVVGVLTIGSSLARFGFAIPITSVTGLARRWADADSPVLLGPPMVTADARTLVLQAADVPFGFTLAVSQEWGPNDPKSWKAEYHRLPTYLVNGQYITSYVQITSSTADAKQLFGSYAEAAKTHGYQNQGLTGRLGDETLTFVLHDSDIDHFEVLWRDGNVVGLLQMDVVAGEANLGNAFQLAAKQQAHIEADLKATGYI